MSEENPILHNIDGIEIFSIGTWKGDEYTDNDLNEMIRAFDETSATVKPPLKLGHCENQKILQADGLPAAGWVGKIYRQGEKLLADFIDIPDKIYKLIKTKAYRKVSSEVFWNIECSGKHYSRMLAGVSLLGADIPAVSNLSDILAWYKLDSNDNKNKSIVKAYIMPQNILNDENKKNKNGGFKMSEEEILELNKKIIESSKAFDALKIENESLKTFKVDAEKKLMESQELTKKAQRDLLLNSFESEKLAAPSMRPYIESLLADEKKEYDISGKKLSKHDVIKELLTLNKEVAKINFAEKSKDSKAEDEGDEESLNKKIEEYMKENKCSYRAAYKWVLGEQNKKEKK